MGPGDLGTIQPDIFSETGRLLVAIAQRGIDARLIGGMAVRLLAGDRLDPVFEREVADIDFVVTKKHARRLGELLPEAGYVGDEMFNALNGARRMLFLDEGNRRQIDVFVDRFVMCHELPLTERLGHQPDTLPAAEVLMTKLQIVSLNPKDRDDIYALLDSHEVARHDDHAVNVARVTELTSDDWGLQRTFEINLQRLRDGLPELALPGDAVASVGRRVDALATAIDEAPKSRRWKLRARIGERKRWYEEPEEVDREA